MFAIKYLKTSLFCLLSLVPMLASCGGEPDIQAANTEQSYQAVLYYQDDDIPWGMDWLPDGSMLVSFRSGTVKLIRNGQLVVDNIKGLPEIAVGGQGGLLDVKVHPDYANQGWIYFSYAREDKRGNKSTAVMRAKLKGDSLVEQQDIYLAQAYDDAGRHFGSRLAFDRQGYLYFSIGDRANRDVNPQDISRDGGKIYRLHDDGRIPKDNPFINEPKAKTAIYSYGHRNPQGMALHPKTGKVWIHEHGPRGGDEVNLIAPGKNYGWPLVSHGVNYSGTKFTELTEKEGMESPLWHWTPSIAPSGMTFVTSDNYPQWQNHLLVGSLKFGYLVMLTLADNRVIAQEKLFEGLIRVRNVKQGSDGFLYVGVDGKGIYRIEKRP